MKTYTFQSGRYYGPTGQEIEVTLIGVADYFEPGDVAIVRINDKTRGLDYAAWVLIDEWRNSDRIMATYDAGFLPHYSAISTNRSYDEEFSDIDNIKLFVK